MPVFLIISLSVGDCMPRKSPWAVQITAAPIPMMTEAVYMKAGDGKRYITMYNK